MIMKIILTRLVTHLSVSISDYIIYKLKEETYNKFLSLQWCVPFTTSKMAQLSTEGIEQLRLYYSLYLPSFFMR